MQGGGVNEGAGDAAATREDAGRAGVLPDGARADGHHLPEHADAQETEGPLPTQ